MNQVINTCVTGLNNIGQFFWGHAAEIFIQSSVLIVLLLVIDFLLRKRVRAVFRYCLWMLVFVKLVLPASFALPTGVGYWLGDYFARDVSAEVIVPQAIPITIDISQEYIPSATPAIIEPTIAGIKLEPICWQGLVFLGWLTGVLVLLALLIQRLYFVRGLIAQSKPANTRLVETLQQCRKQIGIRRNIELRLTGTTLSPAVCGLFKPIILMPATLLEKLSREKLKAVLIHELAHIKRADIWVNLFQTMLQIVYFYNPLVWIANAMVRGIREQAVDEMVLVTLKSEAKSYSNVLIDIAEMVFCKPSFGLRLVSVVESKKALEGRINHMLNRKIPKSAKLGFVGLAAIIIIGVIILPMASGAADEEELLSYVPSTSIVNDQGHIVDKIDYPFVNDPEVLGGWKSVDYVEEIEDFDPAKKSWKRDLFLHHLIFEEGGSIAGNLLTWTKGLVFYNNDFVTASEYQIKEIDGSEYMFYQWKSGDYSIRHSKPSYYVLKREPVENLKYQAMLDKTADIPETSFINEQGRIVDKLDYPFIDDPEIVGTWGRVGHVEEIKEFNVDEKQDKDEQLIFLPDGKTFKPWLTWTKGLIFHSGDKTASKYILKHIGNSTYMFYECKNGDYVFRYRKPSYDVFEKVSSETGGLAEAWASQPSDAEFTKQLQGKIAKLDIDSAGLEDVKKIFGEPAQYIWETESFTEDNLPNRYIMIYPAQFSVFMFKDRIKEIRFRKPGYVFNGAIQVGSTLDEVIENVGEPEETITGQKLEFKKDVLYKDIDGEKGYCYYDRSDKSVRMFFQDYKVVALFVMRTGS